MTFCLGMKVHDGIVGISDTRITAGNVCLTAKKTTIHQVPGSKHTLFLMTSGLRALRDKVLIYFEELIEEQDSSFIKLYQVANAFGEQIRRVAEEDKESLEAGGFQFNLYALMAGQLEGDTETKLFMIFPEGNWVEVGENTPYFIIGNTAHGKALLDRALTYESTMEYALKVGFLSFNATQISSNDVDYPIDVVFYKADSYEMITHRFEREDLLPYSKWWQDQIIRTINALPNDWVNQAYENNLNNFLLKDLKNIKENKGEPYVIKD